MHIHPICGDERHRCAVVASISRLTLSNIDPHSRHSRNLQVKLWATIWTLMPIGRTTARMCSARVKRPNGGGRVRGRPPGWGRPWAAKCFTWNTLTGEALIHVNLCAVAASHTLWGMCRVYLSPWGSAV